MNCSEHVDITLDSPLIKHESIVENACIAIELFTNLGMGLFLVFIIDNYTKFMLHIDNEDGADDSVELR